MIAKSAIGQYLNRHLPSLEPWRHLDGDQIESRLAALRPWALFHTHPWDHQRIGFPACLWHKRLVLLFDMGLGKTKTLLDVARCLMAAGKVRRVLVLVPTRGSQATWNIENRKHTPDLDLRVLSGTPEAREEVVNSAEVVVATYMGWLRMVTKQGRRGWALDLEALEWMAGEFQMVVYDESTAIKSDKALCFRAAAWLADSGLVPYRYALTAAPFGKDPGDLWSQFYAVDRGKALGRTFNLFREAFFRKAKGWHDKDVWVFRKSMIPKLANMIESRSIRFDIQEVRDMPKQIFTKHPVNWHKESRLHYDKAIEAIRASGKNPREMENIFHRLRYLASGLLVVKTDGGERVEARLPNLKMEEMLSKLAEVSSGSRVVIFHEYRASGDWLSEEMDRLGLAVLRLWSGERHQDRVLEAFGQDDRHRVLLANNQAAALSLNLQVANYVFYYESPTSPIIRQQSERRCWRPGQDRHVFYYDFFMRDSIETRILASLREGKDLLADVKAGRAKF